MTQTARFDPQNKVKVCFDCKMFDVGNWVASINWENGLRELPPHETFTVAPKGKVGYPQLLDSLLPWSETISAHLDWWQNPCNVLKGSDQHLKSRLGTHLGQGSLQCLWSDREKRLHINVLEMKAVFLALNQFRD